MKARNIVKTLMTALQSSDLDEAASLLSDDFVLRGWMLEPLGKGEFLSMQSELLNAMPDFSYGLSELKEHHGRVSALIHVSGTHINDLALPTFGLELIPSTGLAIDLPQVHTTYLLEDGKVKEMLVEAVPGGGLGGLLQQIGAELPIPSRLGNSDIKRLNASGEVAI